MLLETSLTHPSCSMSCVRRGHRVLVLASSQWQHGKQPAILLWTGGGSWENFRVLLYFHLYYSPRSPAEFACTAYGYKRLCSSCCISMLLTNSYLFTEYFHKVTKSAARFFTVSCSLSAWISFGQIISTHKLSILQSQVNSRFPCKLRKTNIELTILSCPSSLFRRKIIFFVTVSCTLTFLPMNYRIWSWRILYQDLEYFYIHYEMKPSYTWLPRK